MSQLKITNFKTLRGREGEAYQFDVKLGRTRLASFLYDGWGGETTYDFSSPEVEETLGNSVFEDVKQYLIKSLDQDDEDFLAAVKASKNYKELNSHCRYVSFFEWYGNMIYEKKSAEADAKKLRRAVIKKIHIMYAKDAGKYEVFTKLAYTPENVIRVRRHCLKTMKESDFKIITPEMVDEHGIDVMEVLGESFNSKSAPTVAETSLMIPVKEDLKNLTQEQKEFAFDLVCDSDDWKAPINAELDIASTCLALQAQGIPAFSRSDLISLFDDVIIHFTATHAKFNYGGTRWTSKAIQVIAEGYRMGPAGP